MIRGRVWRFGDHINTDVIMPGQVYDLSEEVQTRATFEAVRPGFAETFREGDVIVAGVNFGTGSSRPAARSLRNLGCACLLADSINGLFLRNCVSFGLLAIECASVSSTFSEGDVAELDLDRWQVTNASTGSKLTASPVEQRLLDLMLSGGIFPHLERDGLIAPRT